MKTGARRRRETLVPDGAIYAADAAIAAVIEEPYCSVGLDELRALVMAHCRLRRALGLDVEYAFVGGVAVSATNRSVVLGRPVKVDHEG